MSNPGELRHLPAATELPGAVAAGVSNHHKPPYGGADPSVPLLNLSKVRASIDSVQKFLSESVNTNTLIGKDQMELISTEISSAIHQIIVNGAALLACAHSPILAPPPSAEIANPIPSTSSTINSSDFNNKVSGSIQNLSYEDRQRKFLPLTSNLKLEITEENDSDEWETIELDSDELLAEHIHLCEICGKGFKRDANLPMHMRAHGNQFKTPEALAKPEKCPEMGQRKTRFSCPFMGCNRNKSHKKFKPLKSVICVKNHFKRSHCAKMYSCNRCNKKSFSVVADLKSHLKHCGEAKWKCSCGTSFSRKDKLFGHITLFEGHMPAVMEEDEKAKGAVAVVEDEEDEDGLMEDMELEMNGSDNVSLEGFLEGFGSIDDFCLSDMLVSPKSSGMGTEMDGFFDF